MILLNLTTSLATVELFVTVIIPCSAGSFNVLIPLADLEQTEKSYFLRAAWHFYK